MKNKCIALLIVAPAVVAIAGVILAALWVAWCWVMPQLYPSGPENLINPGYLLFVATWLLVGIVGRRIFGRRAA